MEIHLILVIAHIIGTILGVGGATMIEIHLNKALRDGTMDAVERNFLGADFLITRIGMGIAILSGIGFIVEYYLNNQLFRLENGVFWAKMIIIVIITINAYLLHKHQISLYWGSAFSFVSWWTAMLLGTFLTNSYSVVVGGNQMLSAIVVLVSYGGAVVIGAYILHKIRESLKVRSEPEGTK